eukprot:gene13556-biopygen14101
MADWLSVRRRSSALGGTGSPPLPGRAALAATRASLR